MRIYFDNYMIEIEEDWLNKSYQNNELKQKSRHCIKIKVYKHITGDIMELKGDEET